MFLHLFESFVLNLILLIAVYQTGINNFFLQKLTKLIQPAKNPNNFYGAFLNVILTFLLFQYKADYDLTNINIYIAVLSVNQVEIYF